MANKKALTWSSDWFGLILSHWRCSSCSNLRSWTLWLNSNLSNVVVSFKWRGPFPPRYKDPSLTILSTRFTKGLLFSYCFSNSDNWAFNFSNRSLFCARSCPSVVLIRFYIWRLWRFDEFDLWILNKARTLPNLSTIFHRLSLKTVIDSGKNCKCLSLGLKFIFDSLNFFTLNSHKL